ncbi:hypothetical protein CHARACLAT_011033 [Characodon lateralis]|uniref:Uncharacterized protein n=1 Tax=Characodon lateralis TaxID=208331 RepID=A0ABU7EJT4_9TELE|nr:hypothetical protein [Characodon lateralis]
MKTGLSVSAPVHPKGVLLFEVNCAIRFFHGKLAYPCLYGSCFVHFYSYLETGRGHPQTVPTLSKVSWYDEVLRIPLTGIKDHNPTSEKQPHEALYELFLKYYECQLKCMGL